MSEPTKVTVDDGKYTWVVDQGRMSCLRYGEPWIDDFTAPGENAVMGLIFEVEDLRDRLKDLGLECAALKIMHRGAQRDYPRLESRVAELEQEKDVLQKKGEQLSCSVGNLLMVLHGVKKAMAAAEKGKVGWIVDIQKALTEVNAALGTQSEETKP